MDIRSRIEKFKNNMKTAGMVAALGTMTLNSSAQTVTKDKQENKIEVVEKSNEFSEYYAEAIVNNNIENVKQLIASGKDFNADETVYKDEVVVGVVGYKEGKSIYPPAIFMAARYNDFEMAEILLKAGANPNYKSEVFNGTTSVFWARSLEMLQLLEKYGADMNAKDNDGYQALSRMADIVGTHEEVYNWNTERAEFLVEKGNSLDNLKYFTPDNAERTKFCVEKSVDFDMDYAVGTAVNVGTVEDLKILLKNGGAKFINVGNDNEVYSSPFETAILSMLFTEEDMHWAKDNNGFYGITPMEDLKKSWEDDKKKVELMISYGADFSNIPEILKLGDGVEAHPETNKFVKQAEAKQAQLNKMKQNQGR